MLLHIRQTLTPQAWEFDVFGRNLSPPLRAALADLASICGLLALASAIVSGRAGWGYLGIMLGAWVLATSLFQPVPRYTYLIYPFLVFCGADLIAQAKGALQRAATAPTLQVR